MRQIFADSAVIVTIEAAPDGVRRAIQKTDHYFCTSNSNSSAFPRTT